MPDYRGELFSALQRLLPQHLLSRLLARVAESRRTGLKNFLIKRFVKIYGVDLTEAEAADPGQYSSFNEFFTRRLKPGARPIDQDSGAIVSPADGIVSQIGSIARDRLFQAKGHHFKIDSLLGSDNGTGGIFTDGLFTTIYLSPKDYHRVHMPIEGRLLYTRYIPGKLFSVNGTTTRHIPNLFARNERLVCLFDTPRGNMALVMVGAMFVAGIETVWAGHYLPGQAVESSPMDHNLTFSKGDELGRFRFGSTVIVLLEKGGKWHPAIKAGSKVAMGQALGDFPGSPPD